MSAKSPSPPPSPRLSTVRLTLYNISQAFIRMRRFRNGRRIVSSSGSAPITHPSLSGAISVVKVPVSREDEFVCASGVDVPKLLRACRSTLLDQARAFGANVLVEEQYVAALHFYMIRAQAHFHRWHTSISPPKNPVDGSYKVQVRSHEQRLSNVFR